jgi:hypothetical protein
MLQWVEESWIVIIVGFLFIGILLDMVVASREAIQGFLRRRREKQDRDARGLKVR